MVIATNGTTRDAMREMMPSEHLGSDLPAATFASLGGGGEQCAAPGAGREPVRRSMAVWRCGRVMLRLGSKKAREGPSPCRATGVGGSASGAGEQRPYRRHEDVRGGRGQDEARWTGDAAALIGNMRNDPMGGRAMGGGGAATGAGEQRPYTRHEGVRGGRGQDEARWTGDAAARTGNTRNDPIGGRAMGGGGAATRGGEQRPYTRHEGVRGGRGRDEARRGGEAAARIAKTRNDPIGGRAVGGGGAATGAGEQRPYTRHGGVRGGCGQDEARWTGDAAARTGNTRNDPIGGRAMGGGEPATGRGEQRPYTRHEGVRGGCGQDEARRVGEAAARIGNTRNDPMGGRATGGRRAGNWPRRATTLYAAVRCRSLQR